MRPNDTHTMSKLIKWTRFSAYIVRLCNGEKKIESTELELPHGRYLGKTWELHINQCLCECGRVRVFVCGGLEGAASWVPPLITIKDAGYMRSRVREVCDDTGDLRF